MNEQKVQSLTEAMPDKTDLRRIFIFWLPLAATWIMMSLEGPYLAAIIARMPVPKFNLAAYGVAFSFAMMIEAPVIMMLSASTALVRNLNSFLKLKNFIYALNAIVTLIAIIFALPPVFNFVALNLIGLPYEVARITNIAVAVLIPWPAAIGYRRFYQGILIRNNMTRRVAYGTVVRLSTMSVTAMLLFLFTNISGAVVGAAALSVAVVFEAAASRLMAGKLIRKLKSGDLETEPEFNPGYKEIFNFYYPLALTSLLTLGIHPMVTFLIGQSRMAIESLAVIPVINSFIFLFRSFGISYQEAAIALLGKNKEGYPALRNYAVMMSVITVTLLAGVALSPLASFWFGTVSGLSKELTSLTSLPLLIMIIFPALEVLISLQRAVLVDSRTTKPITYATVIEVTGLLTYLFISIKLFDMIGVTAAAISFVLGRLGANLYLLPSYLKCLKNSPPEADY